ncbi:Mu transposase domain-containing protein [Streptomyces sp. NRRL S-646]|uniref:Mu transposase domain-containing protein n=1 Tax=Streptomyces sp. NRRL S-646 TaxID=1463917 RepID=UPI00068DD104
MRLPRDHYVRLAADDCSVHPSAIGHLVEVAAGLERVRVACGGQTVASHRRRRAAHQTLTGRPAQEPATGDLRHRHHRS